MTRNTAAAADLFSTQTEYDPEATLTLGPETKRQLLAHAFTRPKTDEETTLRMVAPFVPASVPSPLGDEAGDRGRSPAGSSRSREMNDESPPISGERPTRPVLVASPDQSGVAPVVSSRVLDPARTVVLAIAGLMVVALAVFTLLRG